jgi:hypothetical protein
MRTNFGKPFQKFNHSKIFVFTAIIPPISVVGMQNTQNA